MGPSVSCLCFLTVFISDICPDQHLSLRKHTRRISIFQLSLASMDSNDTNTKCCYFLDTRLSQKTIRWALEWELFRVNKHVFMYIFCLLFIHLLSICFYGKCHFRTKNCFCVGKRKFFKNYLWNCLKNVFFTLASILEGIMNMPKSTTSPWCKSTNPEPTSDSQEDSLDDRMVSGNDTTIGRHPYQVNILEKYMIFPNIAQLIID